MRPSAALALLAASSLLLSATVARAEDARPAPEVDAEVTARISFVQQRLDGGTRAANLWWYGWYLGYGALTLGQASVAVATTTTGLREDLAVGAASASLGVVGVGAPPFPARYAAAMLRETPGATPEARRLKLARAERLLERSARAERFGRSWFVHVAVVAVSTTSGLVLALGYHRVPTGLVQIGAGIAAGEAQIFTQPTAAIHDLRDYRARWPSSIASAPARTVAPSGLGFTF